MPATCRRVNAIGPAILAMVCRKAGVRLLTFSSDLVFDGGHQEPYLERDPVAPLNIYGQSKAEGERRVLALNPSALVVRTSAFFGPSDEANFVTRALSALAGRSPVSRPGRHDDLADLRPRPGRHVARPADRRRLRRVAPGERRGGHLVRTGASRGDSRRHRAAAASNHVRRPRWTWRRCVRDTRCSEATGVS